MGYNETLAHRIEAALGLYPEEFVRKKMFGGIAYLYKGKMTIGAVNSDLTVRVIAAKMEDVLNKAYVRPMDFTGKPMKEFVFVAPEGYRTEEQLDYWIGLGLEHAKAKLSE